MDKLKQWLREWLGITNKDRLDIETLRIWNVQQDERLAALAKDTVLGWDQHEKQLAEANREIDRLRSIICTTPEPVKKVYKPRNWSETSQLMGRI